MKKLSDVKDYLDELIPRLPSSIRQYYRLKPSSMADKDCQKIEASLNITLPATYRKALLTYDWSSLYIGSIQYYGGVKEIVSRNSSHINPMYDLYKEKRFLEIGSYEADSILIALDNTSGETGRIYYLNHAKYPDVIVEPVSRDFASFVICAAIDLRYKKESNFYMMEDTLSHDEREAFFNKIMAEIIKMDPIATESAFCPNFIRGY